MDTQTILAVAGIVATVLIGFWAIVMALRYHRSVQITYAHDHAIALIDDITQNFPELKVLFRDQPVSDNLVLLKGYFINTGRKDISSEMTEKPITLKLPTDFEWIECKVVECSPSMKVTATIAGNNEILLETGLWKVKEYIKIEALAKVPVVKADPDNLPKDYPTSRLLNVLKFPHRIADSKSILETGVPRREFRASRFYKNRWWVMAVFAVVFGASFLCMDYFFPDRTINWRLPIDGQERVMSLRVKGDRVLLTEKDGFEKKFTLQEFDQISDKHPEIVTKNNWFFIISGVLYVVLGLIMLMVSGTRRFRENRLLAIIAGNAKT